MKASPKRIDEQALISLVQAGRGTWRLSALTAASARMFGVQDRSARAVITRLVRDGTIIREHGYYRTPNATDAPPPTVTSDPTSAHPVPPVLPLQMNRGSRRLPGINRRVLLEQLRVRPLRTPEIIALMLVSYGAGEQTTRKTLRLALEYGYVTRRRGKPPTDHAYEYRLTSLAREQLDRYGQLEGQAGLTFARFCTTKPGRPL